MFIIFCSYAENFGQNINKKKINALKIDEAIKIDGDLSETAWGKAEIASDFATYSPTMNETPKQKTEVKILYGDDAIYFGVILYDNEPDKILSELSKRDEAGNTDLFYITLNPYNDGQNIFEFQVSSANVQIDIKKSASGNDTNWNAVWYSEVKITNFGWLVEIKIPYSAIRFSNAKEQIWGVNFWRKIRRIREVSSWNFVDRTFSQGSQAGEITNIKDIKAPFRLAFYPYTASYYEKNKDGDGFSYSLGMDIKYGISESFTLDMTLVPDFGQTSSDNKVLNLSPDETRYNENRQFFTEGTELFNKLGLLYSRRIGQEPSSYSSINDNFKDNEIVANPQITKLLNATKVSGRTKNNLGIGILNAMTENTYASLKDTLTDKERDTLSEPFTNYNIIVLDQSIGKNSYINFTNTNVFKPKTDKIANVSGLGFKFMDKKNIYGFRGKFVGSMQKNMSDNDKDGFLANLNIGKYNGNVAFEYNLDMMDNNYNPNHFGYLSRNNNITHKIYSKFGIYEPTDLFLDASIDGFIQHSSLYEPYRFTEMYLYLHFQTTLHNHLSLSLDVDWKPKERNDYFEARTKEITVFKRPEQKWISGWFSSDYRKKFALDGYFGYLKSDFKNSFWFSLSPIFRINDKISLKHSFYSDNDEGDKGYVEKSDDNIIFGERDVRVITNTLTSTFVYNNKVSFSLKLRHYWSEVIYNQYFKLNDKGYLDVLEKNYEADRNLNIWNIDLVYSWNFSAGSFLSIVWKNEIYNNNNDINKDILYNFNKTMEASQMNSFSIKLSYYLDYNYLKNINKNFI